MHLSRRIAISFALLALCFWVHGHALNEGLFLDDHWHWANWARGSLWGADLAADTTIEPSRIMHMWWQDRPIRFQYFRPLAVWVAKGFFRLLGPDAYWLHLLSILLHALNAVMVFELAWRTLRHAFWASAAAVLFITYSHNIYAVSWLAAQNIVLLGSCVLFILLSYLPSRDKTGGTYARTPLPVMRAISICLALVAGLLVRENAVVLPVFLMAIDLAYYGRAALVARWRFHLVTCAIVGAFLGLRFAYFSHPMPEVYVRTPDHLSYLPWALAKLLHYVTSAVWLSPLTIGPSGRINPWAEVPGDGLLMLAILGLMALGYRRAVRGVRGAWLWPIWIVLSVLPVIPVMATPHSGYLPSIGFSIAMVTGPACASQARDPSSPRSWLRRNLGASSWVAGWFLIATWIYQPIYRGFWSSFRAAEQYTIEQILTEPPDESVDHVFFLNLPFVNIYAPLHLLERGGPSWSSLQYHVLTFAPHVLAMNQTCSVSMPDDHTLDVSLLGDAYFSGLLGRFLLEAMSDSEPPRAGHQEDAGEFSVEVLAVNASGLSSLRFRFRRPLSDPAYAFYLGTQTCPAAALKFEGVGAANPDQSGTMARQKFRIVEHSNRELVRLREQRDRLEDTRQDAAKFIRTDLYLTGPPYPGPFNKAALGVSKTR